jgi:hypothetical protein
MKLITLLFILFVANCSAQKMYTFDYFLEYEKTFYKEDSIKSKRMYLTNSKDNSYYAELTSIDNLKFKLVFVDYDKIYADVRVLKSDFYKAEFINIGYDKAIRHRGIKNYSNKKYDYFLLKDTLINKKECAVYKLRPNCNFKNKTRKSAGANLYIVDKSTSFHMPILFRSLAYEEWKLEGNLPYGIFIEKKHINGLNEDHSSEKLLRYTKIDKKITMPKECSLLY